ncbi:MAG: glycosyltransferase, partial [Gemmatimonadetes bacterium]|nr:glycosyltransferase [Gemmatimonadota bacterium]
MAHPPVSVVIPARNEEEALPRALDSALAQDYPGTVEIVVADGSDGPAMAEMVRARYPEVRLVANPDRIIPAGLNRAVAAAAHPVIVRCDARSELPPGYVSRAVETLARTGAANVGGRQCPAGRDLFTRAVALAMTTPLGAGGARYRLGGAEGPADTVYLGVFRRGALEGAGGFDERFARNEDYELNWRLRQRGGTVWFD